MVGGVLTPESDYTYKSKSTTALGSESARDKDPRYPVKDSGVCFSATTRHIHRQHSAHAQATLGTQTGNSGK